MDIEELRSKQAEFETNRKEINSAFLKIEKERKRFVKEFSKPKLKKLKIDDYIEGKKNRESFCYFIENTLREYGDIHGTPARQFGVYYNKERKEYWKKKELGKNYKKAFATIKSSIILLIEFGKTANIPEVEKVRIPHMFKGKILAMYYPEKYLCIYGQDHLDWFLQELDIPFSDSAGVIGKRDLLMKFKNSDVVMRKWKTWKFMKFLYDKFGQPPTDKVPSVLKPFYQMKLPPINKVKASFIDLEPSELQEKGENIRGNKITSKSDYEKKERINRKVGERGELIVLDKERTRLRKEGKLNLSGNVKHVSKKSDSYGYDILSYDKDGAKRYIEVKATISKPPFANFLISSSEVKKAHELPNYYVYIVFEANTVSPKIFPLKKPFDLPKSKIKVVPVNYRVNINFMKD